MNMPEYINLHGNRKSLFHSKHERCIDCACCDVEKMKCYPDDIDCHSEYDLDEADLTTPKRCDFFIAKEVPNAK